MFGQFIDRFKKRADIVPTLAEKWVEQGRREGRMEGRKDITYLK